MSANPASASCTCGQVVFDLTKKFPGDLLSCPWCKKQYVLADDRTLEVWVPGSPIKEEPRRVPDDPPVPSKVVEGASEIKPRRNTTLIISKRRITSGRMKVPKAKPIETSAEAPAETLKPPEKLPQPVAVSDAGANNEARVKSDLVLKRSQSSLFTKSKLALLRQVAEAAQAEGAVDSGAPVLDEAAEPVVIPDEEDAALVIEAKEKKEQTAAKPKKSAKRSKVGRTPAEVKRTEKLPSVPTRPGTKHATRKLTTSSLPAAETSDRVSPAKLMVLSALMIVPICVSIFAIYHFQNQTLMGVQIRVDNPWIWIGSTLFDATVFLFGWALFAVITRKAPAPKREGSDGA